MDKRINYYVSRNNICTWVSAVILTISVVLRLVNAGMYSGAAEVWGLVVLPVFATVLYLFQMLMLGDEHFYSTSVPAFLICLYIAIKIGMGSYHLAIKFIIWVACIGVAYIYIHTVCGKSGKWLILLILIAFIGLYVYLNKSAFFDHVWNTTLAVSPDLLTVTGAVFALLAMDVYLDGKYHPSWGDRSDGRRVRTLSPMTTVTSYIMPTRTGASNSITDRLEITELEKYIIKKRKEGYKSFGITHIFIAAYVRAVAKYPAINRFCSGQRVYSRGDDIQFCMVVKSSMTVAADDSMVKLHLKPTDTVFDVYEKLSEEVRRIKTTEIGSSDFDKVEKLFAITPRPVLALVMVLLRFLDYFGWLPKALLEISPFHASFFLTSMASLGIEPIVHHLYDFGNMPVFCSIGTKYKVNEPDPNPLMGVHCRHYINYTFNTDERICDGFLYASVFKYIKKLLAHPEILEKEPDEVVQDIP
ncbi:MAG: hypothetical protein Q4E54_08095 [Lachnospiraceae bacterium]|nr:hypothetical protein [Lachnospiraceae bacterium]